MKLQFFFVVTVAFIMTAVVHLFLHARVLAPLAGEHEAEMRAVMIALWAMTFFGFAILRALPVSLRKVFETIMFSWMGIAFFLFLVAFPLSLISWLLSYQLPDRVFSMTALSGGVLLSLVGYFRASKENVLNCTLPLLEPRHFVSSQQESPVIRIAVISDVHVTGVVGKGRLSRIARSVNELKPDLIFVTGDLVDGAVWQLKDDVRALKEMQAPHGVYYVTGNHEYYSGARKWKEFLAGDLGWCVLANKSAHVTVNGVRLTLFGVDDRQSLLFGKKRKKADQRLEKAFAHAESHPEFRDHRENSLQIFLAHQPKDAQLLKDFPSLTLQVSGHTHSGQIWPFSWVVKKDQKYLRGYYALPNRQHLYVSQGTTYWGPPFRLGTECEISLLELVATKTA